MKQNKSLLLIIGLAMIVLLSTNVISVEDQIYATETFVWYDENNNYQEDTGTDPLITTTIDKYDEWGNVLEITDPLSNKAYMKYDSYQNAYLTSGWNDVIGSQQEPNLIVTYDKFGNVITKRSITGETTSFQYDGFGRLKGLIQPGDIESRVSYDYEYALDQGPVAEDNLNAVKVTQKLNNLITTETASLAEGLGNVIQSAAIKDDSSTIRSNTYFDERRLVEKKSRLFQDSDVSNPPAGTTGTLKPLSTNLIPANTEHSKYEYEDSPLARTKKLYPAETEPTIYSEVQHKVELYNGKNRKIVDAIDPEGIISRTITDNQGNTITSYKSYTNIDQAKTEYLYDALGRLLETTNDKGQKTTFTYDSRGNVLCTYNPDAGKTCNEYDDNGNKEKSIIYSCTSETTCTQDYEVKYVYDGINRIKSVDYNNDGSTEINYEYDDLASGAPGICVFGFEAGWNQDHLKGKLVSITDKSGIRCFYYNEKGQIIKKRTEVQGSVTKLYDIYYQYDYSGNLVGIRYPDVENDGINNIIGYSYNKLGQTQSIGLLPNGNMETDQGKDYYPELTNDDSTATNSIPDGWKTNNPSKINIETTEKNNGIQSTKVSSDGTNQVYLAQDIPTIKDHEYEIEGWIKITGTPDPTKYYGIFSQCMTDYEDTHDWVCDLNSLNTNLPPVDVWTKISFNVKADKEDSVLRIVCLTDEGADVYCDDITVNGKYIELEYNPEGTINKVEYPNLVSTDFTYDNKQRVLSFQTNNYYELTPESQSDGTWEFNPEQTTSTLTETYTYDNVNNIKTLVSSSLEDVEFTYDGQHRLTEAKPITGSNQGRYEEELNYKYDSIGRILYQNQDDTVTPTTYTIYDYEPSNTHNKLEERTTDRTTGGADHDHLNEIKTQYTYDIKGNLASKSEFTNIPFCAVGYSKHKDTDNAAGEYILFGVNAPVGSQVSVLFDYNDEGVHYTWGDEWSNSPQRVLVESYAQATETENNIYCDWDIHPRTIVRISEVERISSQAPSSTNWESWLTTQGCTNWYDCEHKKQYFSIIEVKPSATQYYWDYSNRLEQINYATDECSKFTYNADGLRATKTDIIKEDGYNSEWKTTYYLYEGNNVIYEETETGTGGICTPPTNDVTTTIETRLGCGDGIIQQGEECDAGASNGACPSSCSAQCTIQTCCGNGIIDAGEQCDNGASNGACPATCSASCYTNSCGGGGGRGGGGIQ